MGGLLKETKTKSAGADSVPRDEVLISVFFLFVLQPKPQKHLKY